MNSRTGRSRLWRHGRSITLLVLLAMLLESSLPLPVVHPASAAARETATVPGVADPFTDVVPEALASAERAADTLSAISMDVAFDPALSTIGRWLRVNRRKSASTPPADP